MDTKVCSKCGVEKALCEFSKCKTCKQGKNSRCKLCKRAEGKAYREVNKQKEKERLAAYYKLNKESCKARNKRWREANKEKEQERGRRWREANKEKNRERKKLYERKRRTDPFYKVRSNVSRSINHALNKRGAIKRGKTFEALPYTPKQLIEHLESQFDDQMSWENYGSYWDVDHIYPHSLLPYDSMEHPNFAKCWALENLQPLEKIENIKKSNKVFDEPLT